MVRRLTSPPPICVQPQGDRMEKEMKRAILLMVSGTFALMVIGCANTSANLQRETARSIGGITSEQVTVSDVQRGMTDVKWKAATPSGLYNCEADDMVRRVNCVKK